MPFAVVCAIHPLTCTERLAEFKILDHIPAVPFPGCLLWEGNGSGMLCLSRSAATDSKSHWRLPVVKAFHPVQVCALMCPGTVLGGLQWDNPLLPNGAGSSWAASSSIRKDFKTPFAPTMSCCLNQAHVFPLWHEFCLVTFWLPGWVLSILNLLNECTWKVFSLFDSLTNCFHGFGMLLLFLSTPASLPLFCYKQPTTTSLIIQDEYEGEGLA